MRMPKEVTLVKKSLDEHKAEDITVVDVREKTPFTDYLVIASGTNSRMLGALASYVEDDLLKNKVEVRKTEGIPESGWIIVDAGNVVVHLFSPEKRSEIDLEGLLAGKKPE